MQLSPYNCSIEHIKGVDTTIADMLSRPLRQLPSSLEVVQPSSSDELDIDVPEHTYQFNILDYNKFVPKQYASYEARPEQREYQYLNPKLDMRVEQL